MSLDPRRLAYLRAMGITVWARRVLVAPVHDGAPPIVLERVEDYVPDQAPRVVEPPVEDAAIAEMDWVELEAAVSACSRCALHASRTRPVFGVGDHRARWLLVGEAPGADEDRQGNSPGFTH